MVHIVPKVNDLQMCIYLHYRAPGKYSECSREGMEEKQIITITRDNKTLRRFCDCG